MTKMLFIIAALAFGLGGCFFPGWVDHRREVIVVPDRDHRQAPEERRDRHDENRRDDYGR